MSRKWRAENGQLSPSRARATWIYTGHEAEQIQCQWIMEKYIIININTKSTRSRNKAKGVFMSILLVTQRPWPKRYAG